MENMMVPKTIKAKQLILCNVRDVTDDNEEGKRNTLAVKFFGNNLTGYDLVSKRFIPFYSKSVRGECMEILNTPYINNNTKVDLEEIYPMLEGYRNKLYPLDTPFQLDQRVHSTKRYLLLYEK